MAENPPKSRPVAPGAAIERTDKEIDADMEALLQSVAEEAQAEQAKYSPKLDAILKAKEKDAPR